MDKAGLLNRSAEAPWAGTVVWPTERGARIARAGLSASNQPKERLLHRLAADDGIGLKDAGQTVLTEREIPTAEVAHGRAVGSGPTRTV
ncbi:hypothetical protein Stsp01_38470 [Streptomyces sp. NBRC 13847]|nr:hypothetical protein Stsp01_38470 [Streptomyces sp. NBRC 13847]